MELLRIVLVDDHNWFREGLASLLEAELDIKVVGHGISATDAVRLAQTLLPDIVMLGMSVPGSGLAATRAIAECCPNTCVVILATSMSEEDVVQAAAARASAYIVKGVGAPQLVTALRAIVMGPPHPFLVIP